MHARTWASSVGVGSNAVHTQSRARPSKSETKEHDRLGGCRGQDGALVDTVLANNNVCIEGVLKGQGLDHISMLSLARTVNAPGHLNSLNIGRRFAQPTKAARTRTLTTRVRAQSARVNIEDEKIELHPRLVALLRKTGTDA